MAAASPFSPGERSRGSLIAVPVNDRRHLGFETTGHEDVERTGPAVGPVLEIMYDARRHAEKGASGRIDMLVADEEGESAFKQRGIDSVKDSSGAAFETRHCVCCDALVAHAITRVRPNQGIEAAIRRCRFDSPSRQVMEEARALWRPRTCRALARLSRDVPATLAHRDGASDVGRDGARAPAAFRSGSARVQAVLVGTLVVDISDARTSAVVWRSLASCDIRPNDKPEAREKTITKATEKMFKNYPPQSR